VNPQVHDNVKRLLPTVFFISVAVIGWQLVLMRCLLLSRYHHFSFLVISCALLGFGGGGVLIALRRRWFERHFSSVFRWGTLSFALSLPICFRLGEQLPVDVYFPPVAFVKTLGWWSAFWSIHSIPFLISGTLIGLAFVAGGKSVHKIYASNLAGSAAGSLAAIGLLSIMPSNGAVVPLSASVALCCLFLIPSRTVDRRLIFSGMTVIALLLLGIMLLTGPARFFPPNVDQFKALAHVQSLEQQGDAKRIFTRDGPRGRIDVFSSPRFHTLLSLGSIKAPPPMDLILRDGFEVGSILAVSSLDQAGFLKGTLAALPYKLVHPNRVLILGETGGNYVRLARLSSADLICVIQGDKNIVDALKSHKSKPLDDPRIRVVVTEPRAFLDNAKMTFDIIHLAALEGFLPGSGGIGGLREDYLATVEGFGRCLDLLTPSGIATVIRGIQDPPRDNIKIAAMWIEALEKRGVKQPGLQILMARDELGFATLAGRSPCTAETVENFRRACAEMSWEAEWFPGIKPEQTNRIHVLPGPDGTSISWFHHAMRQLLSPRRENFFREWISYVRPATDDSPFFYDFFKWRSVSKLRDAFGPVWPARAEMGFLLLIFAACFTFIVAALLLPGPIWLLGREDKTRTRSLILFVMLFFSALGIGFMFVEMSFIQMFTRFLGDPVLAAALVLGAILFFAGVGSMAETFLAERSHRGPLICIFLLSAVIILCTKLLPHLFEATAFLTPMWKVLIGVVFLAPPAFLMGVPFPSKKCSSRCSPGLGGQQLHLGDICFRRSAGGHDYGFQKSSNTGLPGVCYRWHSFTYPDTDPRTDKGDPKN